MIKWTCGFTSKVKEKSADLRPSTDIHKVGFKGVKLLTEKGSLRQIGQMACNKHSTVKH